MKEFNLARALAGDPVVTRAGKNVEEIYLFSKANETSFALAVVIEGAVALYTEKGRYYATSDRSEKDLFMAPIKRQEWRIMQYHLDGADPTGQSYTISSQYFESEAIAIKYAEDAGVPNFVKVVLIREWEE